MAVPVATTLGEKILFIVITILISFLILVTLQFTYTQELITSVTSKGSKLHHGALIVYERREEFVCNVHLITTTWALSCAACIQTMHHLNSTKNLWFIKTGVKYWNEHGSKRLIKNYIVHPDYEPETLESNIGLIEVVKPFHKAYVMDWKRVGRKPKINGGMATGWQKPFYSIIMVEELFKHKPVVALTEDDCRDNIERYEMSTNNTLCVTPLVEGTCFPGMGYALMERKNLIAIKSWGDPCLAFGPHVLTKLFPYMNWIREITGQN